jgi:formylglycine-generating enzyme required for sulfatase activity
MHEYSPGEVRERQREAAESLGLAPFFADTLDDGSRGPELAVIPPGVFEMGSPADEFGHRPDEAPVHYVAIERVYAIGRYTITAEEFERFRRDTEWYLDPDLVHSRERQPMINIRYGDAELYAAWLSRRTGQRYRLPSEAEWEYAARAGTRGPFHYGETASCAEVHFNSAFPYEEARQGRRWFLPRRLPSSSTEPVGAKPANAWGLHDMHGNVWEFTASPWTDSHHHSRRDGGIEPGVGDPQRIVVKGGSWFDAAIYARSAARRPRLRDEMDVNLGLRLVRELTG